jgi:hypothetical protein
MDSSWSSQGSNGDHRLRGVDPRCNSLLWGNDARPVLLRSVLSLNQQSSFSSHFSSKQVLSNSSSLILVFSCLLFLRSLAASGSPVNSCVVSSLEFPVIFLVLSLRFIFLVHFSKKSTGCWPPPITLSLLDHRFESAGQSRTSGPNRPSTPLLSPHSLNPTRSPCIVDNTIYGLVDRPVPPVHHEDIRVGKFLGHLHT